MYVLAIKLVNLIQANKTFQVYYEDPFDKELFEDKDIVKSVTCVLLTGTQPADLLAELPKDIESLTLIQGSESGNKSLKFSLMNEFEKLITLEMVGADVGQNDTYFTFEIDAPVPNMQYLNLERVRLKNSKMQTQKFINEISDEDISFEYVYKHDPDAHPLTMVRKEIKEVLPYKKYLQREKSGEAPLFIGFDNLIFLRISNCELNNVHWEMFDGLHDLKYLMLEKNSLRFIPDFAFYGTPNLKSLSLAYNNLLSIQITDLAGLLELEYLDLSHNNFSQLSELSLPPFPKLKLANFANNPISVIFPNTFEVMNTTDSLIVGGDEMPLSLLANSFFGLTLLKSLTVNNINIPLLKRELLTGLLNLDKLVLTGNITEIEFDAFLEVKNLDTLILSKCNLRNLSMDSFIGLEKLTFLDMSDNQLDYLPPSIFDQLQSLRELYLHKNNFSTLPRDIFSKLHLKLLRLTENPWHCSCDMSEWKPTIVNKIKQKTIKPCEMTYDKAVSCKEEDRFTYKYVYETRVAPKCASPEMYLNWNVFHVMRRQFKCPDFKPKLKKMKVNAAEVTSTTTIMTSTVADTTKIPEIANEKDIVNNKPTFAKIDILNSKYSKVGKLGGFGFDNFNTDTDDGFNNLNPMGNSALDDNIDKFSDSKITKLGKKIHKYRKKYV